MVRALVSTKTSRIPARADGFAGDSSEQRPLRILGNRPQKRGSKKDVIGSVWHDGRAEREPTQATPHIVQPWGYSLYVQHGHIGNQGADNRNLVFFN